MSARAEEAVRIARLEAEGAEFAERYADDPDAFAAVIRGFALALVDFPEFAHGTKNRASTVSMLKAAAATVRPNPHMQPRAARAKR